MTHDEVPDDQDVPVGLDVLLSDPSLWAEPSPTLEAAVTRLVTDAALASASPPPPELLVLDERQAGSRRPSLLRAAAGIVVVVGALGTGVVIGERAGTAPDPIASPTFRADLAPTGASRLEIIRGTASFVPTDSGWRIDLDVTGLARRVEGEFYEAWLRDADDVLVSVGTFNEGNQVVLWAGVSPERFARFSVTREVADGDPTSSGDVAAAGPVTRR